MGKKKSLSAVLCLVLALALMGGLGASAVATVTEPERAIIIDTDPGTDDSAALMLAQAKLGGRVKLLVSSYGNSPLAATTANAAKLADLYGMEAAVIQGAAGPVPGARDPGLTEGADGISAAALPASKRAIGQGDTSDLLYAFLKANPGAEYVVLGPMTNLANLLEKHPTAEGLISRVVTMAGGLEVFNMDDCAEFNVYCDPIAAQRVFASNLSIHVVPLDTTNQMVLTHEELLGIPDKSGDGSVALEKILLENEKTSISYGLPGAVIFDAAALAYMIEPTLFSTRTTGLEVSAGENYGQMTQTAQRSNITLVEQPNRDGVYDLLVGSARSVFAASEEKALPIPLENANVGVMTGSTAERFIESNYPAATVSTFSAIADGFLSLSGGKIDYVLTAYTTALNVIRSHPELEIVQEDVIRDSSSVAVSKSRPNLLSDIDRVLSELKADGTLDRLVANWTTQGQDYVVENSPVSDGANGVLRVAIAADREPMCFVMDGQYRGLDCELISYIAYALGMTVEYQDMPFGSLVAALASGKADVIISNMTDTEERRKSVNFTQSYFENPQVFVAKRTQGAVRTANPEFTAFPQLEGKRFAALNGTVFDTLIRSRVQESNFSYYASTADMMAALKANRVDGVTLDEPVARLAVSRNKGTTIMPEPVAADSYGLGLVKGSPLTPKVDEAIAALWADGTLVQLQDKWMGSDESVKVLIEQDWPGETGVLRYYHDIATEPMSYAGDSGTGLGYDLDVVLLIGKALDMRVELTPVSFDALIPALQSGKADIVSGCMSITDERRKAIDLTEPYYNGAIVLVVRDLNEVEAVGFWAGLRQSFESTFLVEGRWKMIASGLSLTVFISICSGILGTVLGFLVCMLRRSNNWAPRRFSGIFIRIVQGTPIVVLLMILYYVVFGATDVSAVAVSILGFAINFAAYVSEMMRSGIDAVDGGQIEAATALGYSRFQTFWKVTFPQAARHFLPVFKGEFVSMVKMTSVVGYVAVQDLTKVSDIIRGRTMEAFFPLIVTAILYFLIANVLTLVLSYLEVRLDPKRRPRTVKGVTEK